MECTNDVDDGDGNAKPDMDGSTRSAIVAEIVDEAIRNSVWASRPVEQEPTIVLSPWMIIELPYGGFHCVGYNAAWPEGRVSSPMVSLDVATMHATTRTGRVYVLRGPSGWHADAHYVLGIWLRANGVTWDDVVDVSDMPERLRETLAQPKDGAVDAAAPVIEHVVEHVVEHVSEQLSEHSDGDEQCR